MRVWPLAVARYNWLRETAGEQARRRAVKDEIPLRTVFNSWTREFEDLPLSQFQLMIRQGKIQETISWRQDGPPEYVYRLV